MTNKRKWGVLPILIVFLTVPFISSLISTFHIADFVGLGNGPIMAWALAITYELGSIVSFIALSPSILGKLKKGLILFIFLLLFLLQATGNIYSSFEFMRSKLIEDPAWLSGIMEMTMNFMNLTQAKLVLSIVIGLPIPLISLILLKSAIDYLNIDDSGKKINNKKSSLNSEVDALLANKKPVTKRPIKKKSRPKRKSKPKPTVFDKPVDEPAKVVNKNLVEKIVEGTKVEPAKVESVDEEMEFGILKDTDEKKNPR